MLFFVSAVFFSLIVLEKVKLLFSVRLNRHILIKNYCCIVVSLRCHHFED